MKYPSAWIPILFSAISLVLTLLTVAITGAPQTPPADEGTAAHLFQLWLVLEVLMILFFAVRWLPRSFKAAACVLTVQIVTVIAACSPVFILGL